MTTCMCIIIVTQLHKITMSIIAQLFFSMSNYMCNVIATHSHTSTTWISNKLFFNANFHVLCVTC
jgi:hypothetical protein